MKDPQKKLEELKIKERAKRERMLNRARLLADKRIQKLKDSAMREKWKVKSFTLKKIEKLKRPSKKELKNKLWRLISQYVRIQSAHCFTCGIFIPDMRDRSTGHFWTRGGHPSVAFDLDNLRVQCTTCNNWKSGNLAEYAFRLEKDIGTERYNALRERAYQTRHFTIGDYEIMTKEMKEKLNSLTSQNETQ